MKSEYAIWKAELDRGPRKLWPLLVWTRPEPVKPAEPDHFVWKDVGDLFEENLGVTGLSIKEVTTTVTERNVWRERTVLRVVAA